MTLKQLLIGVCATFALPWLVLIAGPYASFAKAKPVPYVEDAGDELKGFYPATRSGTEARGQEVYFNNGCAQCHTQIIRQQLAGTDGDEFKQTWGEDQTSKAPVYVRSTRPEDYLGESYAAIGQRRVGPDLANVGYRFTTARQVLAHLFNPQARHEASSCPPQRQMFEVKSVESQPLETAIVGVAGLGQDEQALANGDARALADYIISLKKNTVLPASLAPKKAAGVPAPAAAAPATPAAPAK
jgi:cytochrome c oxidase cbb3-type subunit II